MFMKKYLFLFVILFFITNCTLNKVVMHHGVHFLDKKQSKLVLNTSNKNEIISLLGSPSTTGTFNNDMWIYIERNTSSSRLTKLGQKKLLTNNILVLELDNKGILVEKIFLTKEDMLEIDFSRDSTDMSFLKTSFVYDFLSSMRQKVNDPLNKRGARVPKN